MFHGFPPYSQYSQTRLWLHSNPEQDKALTLKSKSGCWWFRIIYLSLINADFSTFSDFRRAMDLLLTLHTNRNLFFFSI